MYSKLGRVWIYTVMFILMFSTRSWAVPMVFFSADDLGGGLFQYNLSIANNGGTEPISGLSILPGNSIFGLDDFSLIAAPADWSFLAPLPGFADNLDFFSLNSAADVPINGVLGGFSFQSTAVPDSLGGSFDVRLISAVSNTKIPIPAIPTPEPTTIILLGSAIVGLLVYTYYLRRADTLTSQQRLKSITA